MSLAKDHFEKKAGQSKKNRASGTGGNVVIDLVKTYRVRFTKDIGYIKAGHEQSLSETAYEIYKEQGVVELVN